MSLIYFTVNGLYTITEICNMSINIKGELINLLSRFDVSLERKDNILYVEMIECARGSSKTRDVLLWFSPGVVVLCSKL